MKFSVSREDLFRVLRVVSGVVERKPQQNQVLSNVFLSLSEEAGLEAIATDQEIELTAKTRVNKIEQEGKTLIPCRKLNEICRVLPDGAEIFVDSSANKTLIKAGQSKFVLSAMSAEQFPKAGSFVEQQVLVVPRVALIRLLEKTAYAMAEQDVRYFLNGMLLEVGNIF